MAVGESMARKVTTVDEAAEALVAFSRPVAGVVAVESQLRWPQNGNRGNRGEDLR